MVSAYFAGLHYWWPKLAGRLYPEIWARAAAIVMFLGFNLTFLPQFILGSMGRPRRYATYDPQFQIPNVLSSAGTTILAVSYLAPLVYVTWSLLRGPHAPANPWRRPAWNGRPPRRRRSRILPPRLSSPPPPTTTRCPRRLGVMSEQLARHHAMQFESPAHQARTALAGMWLFLATEMLFLGGLFLVFIFCRHQNRAGFDLAGQHTTLWIGAVNTAILVTSSAVFSVAPMLAGQGWLRRVPLICAATAGLGVAFLVLKGIEWSSDFAQHLWPGAEFALADHAGAALFFSFYFVATFLHGLHMLIGLGLLAWLAGAASPGRGHG